MSLSKGWRRTFCSAKCIKEIFPHAYILRPLLQSKNHQNVSERRHRGDHFALQNEVWLKGYFQQTHTLTPTAPYGVKAVLDAKETFESKRWSEV